VSHVADPVVGVSQEVKDRTIVRDVNRGDMAVAGPVRLDPISSENGVTVKEVLLRPAVADVRFPLNLAGRRVEAPEEAVTGAEVHAVPRDHGGVGESAAGCKLPEDFRVLRLGVRP
jgi:hypothetical protein